jgi:anti-sigma regulatory factor (Ser/Thr protein kinase)
VLHALALLPVETASVVRDIDVFGAREAARRHAQAIGFSSRAVAEIVLVVSELASNILKYGVRGSILLDAVADPGLGAGLRIVASDHGPPFRDLALAMRDGHADHGRIEADKMHHRGGFGGGLGAVSRLTDSFHCEPEPHGKHGKRITVVRYVHRPRPQRGHSRAPLRES